MSEITLRQRTEDFIIKYIEKIAPGIGNKEIYQKFFSNLSNTQFYDFMNKLEKEEINLAIFIPNSKANVVSIENNLKLAKELGYKFFSKLLISGKKDLPDHMTPVEYLILDLPFRRASQIISKKIKIPKSNRIVDSLSGQPTGISKGAKISYPELLILASMGLDNSIKEMISIRGGDNKAFLVYNNFIDKYGKVTLNSLENFKSIVKSTSTLKTFLTAMHIKTTL